MCIRDRDGADSVERDGDHEDSIYYAHPDFYNMKSTDSLTILSNFKTLQQSSEWSCGVDSALMVLNYYDKLGSYTEESLANFRTNKLEAEATSLRSMINIFEGVGAVSYTHLFLCFSFVPVLNRAIISSNTTPYFCFFFTYRALVLFTT